MSAKVVDMRRRGFQPNLGRGARVHRTEYRRGLTATKLAAGRVHLRLVDELDVERPRTRADCINGPRPCPWVGCRHNAFLDVTSSGSITFNQGDAEPDEVPAERSCTLDIADRGGSTLEDVSEVFRFTRQAANNLEGKALASLKRRGRVLGEFSDAPPNALPRKLAEIALLSLELANLDAFIERTADVPEAALHRDLAIAVAGVQRVAHAQLAGDAST